MVNAPESRFGGVFIIKCSLAYANLANRSTDKAMGIHLRKLEFEYGPHNDSVRRTINTRHTV